MLNVARVYGNPFKMREIARGLRHICSAAKDLEKMGAHNFESGGRGFESLRARHFGTKLGTQKPAVLALEAATSVRSSTPTELAAGCQKNCQQAGGNEEIQRSFLCEHLSLCKQKYENKRSRHRCDCRPHIQAPIPASHALTGQLLGLQ
jgi:hypothetical protein